MADQSIDGHIYIMGGDGGPLKIGRSTNVHSRLKTLRWHLKRDLSILFWLQMSDRDLNSVEKLAHHILRDYALGYELFDVDLTTAKDAVCEARSSFLEGRRAPKATDDPAQRVGVVAPRCLINRINAWRKRQEDLPNLSDAIRRLVSQSLEEDERRLPGHSSM